LVDGDQLVNRFVLVSRKLLTRRVMADRRHE
jgi:hypothetical protein